MARIPAFWYEGDYHPIAVNPGYLLDVNEEGEAIFEPLGGGREILLMHERMSFFARCSVCGDWSERIAATGEHLTCAGTV